MEAYKFIKKFTGKRIGQREVPNSFARVFLENLVRFLVSLIQHLMNLRTPF